MKFSKYDHNTLFCFSPPVMLATLVIEFIGAIYVLLFSKLKPVTAVIFFILICLECFQLAEYQVCRNASIE